MGIRYLHDHTDEHGKVYSCFTIGGRNRLTQACILEFPEKRGFFSFRLEHDAYRCTAAYMPYTGSWYLYNYEGKEIASVHRDFFEAALRRFVIGELQGRPEADVCIAVASS